MGSEHVADRLHILSPLKARRPDSKRTSVTSSVKPGDFEFPSVTTGYICHAWKSGVGLVYTEVVTLVRLAKNEGENVIEF